MNRKKNNETYCKIQQKYYKIVPFEIMYYYLISFSDFDLEVGAHLSKKARCIFFFALRRTILIVTVGNVLHPVHRIRCKQNVLTRIPFAQDFQIMTRFS